MLNTGSLDDVAVWGGSGNGRWDLASGSRSLGPYLALIPSCMFFSLSV